jgi:hypothetical protein
MSLRPRLSAKWLFLASIAVLFATSTSAAWAAARFAVASGPWASTSTWSATSGGAAGASFPVAGDDATIEGGFTVTMGVNAAATNVTVKNASTLDAGTFTLVVSSAFTLQAGSTFKQGGGVTTPPGATRSFDAASTYVFNGTQTTINTFFTFGNLVWSAGNSTPSGNLQINGNLTINASSLRGSTGSGTTTRTHNVLGNVIIDGSAVMLIGTNATAAGTGTWNIGGNVTTQNGGILRGCNTSSVADGVFNIAGNLTNNGTVEHGPGTGQFTINFNGGAAQSVSGTATPTMQNVTISNSSASGVSTSIPMTWTGAGTVNSGSVLALGGLLTSSSGPSVNGTLRLNNGGAITASPTYGLSSSLMYNMTGSNATGPEWSSSAGVGVGVPLNLSVLIGTVAPTGSRSVPGTLTCSTGGIALTLGAASDLFSGTSLVLNGDRIVTSTSKVVASGTIARTSGYVDGNLQRSITGAGNVAFDIGTGSTYSPVAVNFTSIGGSGNLLASATAPISAPVGASGLSATKYVSRSWTLTNGGITSPAYDATFTFDPTDLQGGTNTNNLIVAKNTGGVWSNPTVGTRTATSTQATGLNAFSTFELGEQGCSTITLAPAAGALPGATTGNAYNQTISSSGGATPVTYAVTSGSLPAGLSLASGGALTGTPTALGSSSFTVTATDANGCSGSAAYTLAVTCGAITVAPTSLPGATTGVACSQTITASGGTGAYTFAVTSGSLPAGLSLASGGALSGTPTTAGAANFDVTATDANSCTGVRSYSIVVSCPAVAVAPAAGALPGANTTDAYSQTITASGGSSPYTFTVTSGSVPTGLSLASGGALTGTATALGSASFTVTATDAHGCTASAAYTLDVTCGAVALAPGSLPNGTQNSAYGQTIAASGGTGPSTFAVTGGTLPTGLSLASGGALTGTPTGTGSSSFDVTATDANGCTGLQSYALTIDPAAVNTVSPVSASACVTPAHPCQTVPVNIARGDATGMRLFHVTFQLSADLQLCSTPGASVTEGAYLTGANPNTTFLVTPNGGGSYTVDGTINGSPCGATAASGNLFNIGVAGTGTTGTGTVTLTALTLRDCANNTLASTMGGPASVTIDTAPVSVAAIPTPANVVELSTLIITPAAVLTSCATGPVTWSVAPALPAGATFNTTSGEIQWTPPCGTAGTYGPFTLTATAASGDAGSSNAFSMVVAHKTYTIAASAGAGGSISPSGSASVNCGEDQAFTITPDACHTIADVLVDGVSQGAVTTFTFTNVTGNHTIAASFNLVSYTITASAGAGGAISPSGVVAVGCGANQSFTITPDACHAVADVLVDGVSQGAVTTFTFTNVTGNHIIAASFNLVSYTITASAGAGGSISPSGAVAVGCGADQAITITPDACHTIADVLVDGVSQGAVTSYTFTNVTGNHTIAASFNLVSYTITASAGAGGSISPSGNVPVGCGASQSFTIAPDACHTIADVVVDGVSQGAVTSYTFTNVTGNHTIAASFSLIAYTLTASAGAGGSISPSGNVSVGCGASQSFTIAGDACHTIADVLVDGVSQGAIASYTFTNVTGAHTIAASFALTSYTIVAGAGSGGSITPSGTVSVSCGANQSFSIAPDGCHTIADVLVDGVSQGAIASYTFTNVIGNHTIAASFSLVSYTISASAGAGGAITPSGNVSVGCGANQAFTIAGDACHNIADVLVDGVSQGAIASYTFTNVTGDHTIAASFVHVAAVVPAPTAVSATQVLLGNPAGSRTGIVIHFGSVVGAASYKVYRAPYGHSPEYDDNGGAAPTAPTTWPPAAPWTLTGVTVDGGTDTPPTRDFWYYAVYAENACGDVSVASSMTGGTLDYHLGDVSDNVTPGTGDNLVDAADISLLGAHYGFNLAPNDSYDYLDVGPTSTNYVDGRPLTDDRVDFEDLVIFAINFGEVTTVARTAPPAKTDATPATKEELTLFAPAHVALGDDVAATLSAQATGLVQALSVRLTWNPDVVAPDGATAGALLAGQNGVLLSATPGTFDFAILGTDQALVGAGTLATVRFKVIAAGDPGIDIAGLDARDTKNRKVVMDASRMVEQAAPTVTTLQPVAPNPSRGAATLSFSLAQRGMVDVSIYSVDGRLVRTLLHGVKDAGVYALPWDGRDAHGAVVSGGVFFAHMTTEHAKFTRTLTRVR